MDWRRWVAAGALVFLLSSCASSDEPEPARRMVSEPAESVTDRDARLILDLWEHLERSSGGGLDAWGEALVESQYPGFGATFGACTYLSTGGPDFRVAYEVDPSSIQAVPQWTVPEFNPPSPMSGDSPVGRTYSMTVRTSWASGGVHDFTQHVTVRDGEAFSFPICEVD